ncbi:MAG: hypothetical protein EPN17_00665 [Methylobacter sp.]|nr:MAG: hypothetical protein EPN17_00665 [Methylobacter sp.]
MITLITGTPGSGKTVWIFSELVRLFFASVSPVHSLLIFLKLIKAPKKQLVERDVYVHGIPDLDFGVSYTTVYCRSPLCDVCQSEADIVIPEPLFNKNGEYANWREVEAAEAKRDSIRYVEDWPEWATVGALIIIDEVQRIWRPRSAGSTVPPEISALETHRHKGIDFWLISQSPSLLDMNIRRLVGRHIHLVSSWRGRTQHEWAECKQSTSSTSDAISRPYVMKKSVFTKFKSSSLHTKLEKRPPLAIYVIAICLVVLAWIGHSIYKRHATPDLPVESLPVDSSKPQSQPLPNNLNTTVEGAIPVKHSSVPAGAFDFTPRVKSRAETAPAYDGMLKIQSVPFPETCSAWTTETEKHCSLSNRSAYAV